MLEQLQQTGIIYDVEIFKNALVVTCYSLRIQQYRVYSWYKDTNNINELINLITNKTDRRCWIGYNSLQFDNGVMDHLIYNRDITLPELWEFSQTLISGNKSPYKYNTNFTNSLDLLEVIREGYNVKSLKAVAVNLKHHKIQDLPIAYDKEITDDQFELLVEYNKNDVDITHKILVHITERLEMRQVLSQHYNIDVLSSADSYIAKKLFDKFYYKKVQEKYPNTDIKQLKQLRTKRDIISISDLVLPGIHFQTPELQEFFNTIKTLNIVRKNEDDFVCEIPELEYAGMRYTVALGGIHSVDSPLIIHTPDDELLLDIDIASQYPTAIINYKICPAHLDPDVFIPIVQDIVAKRLWYKRHKNENSLYSVLEKGMKVTINTIYGLFNFQYYFLYDPYCTFKVTINNQLWILMLIERLHLAGYKCISANTDGLLLHIKKDELNQVRELYHQWEQESGFTLEENYFSIYVRRDINNYACLTTDNKKKTKGVFVPQGGILKGFIFPVIAKALQAYYFDGVDPEEFLYNYNDIYDFCMSQKTSGKFHNYLYKIEKNLLTEDETIVSKQEVQKTLRFFVSKPEVTETTITGYIIKKVEHNVPVTQERVVQRGFRMSNLYHEESRINPATGRMKKFKDVILDGVNIPTIKVKEQVLGDREISLSPVGAYITMFNDYYDVPHFSDYNLDIDWYCNEVYRVIEKIGRIK